MPADGLQWLPKQAVMTAGEIQRIVGIGVERLGVRELRLTGGASGQAGPRGNYRRAAETSPPASHLHDHERGRACAAGACAQGRRPYPDQRVPRFAARRDFHAADAAPFLSKVLAGVEEARAAGLGPVNINVLESNNKSSIQEGKEVTGHTTGQQGKRPPKGPISEQKCAHSEAHEPLKRENTAPEVGLEPHSRPCKH